MRDRDSQTTTTSFDEDDDDEDCALEAGGRGDPTPPMTSLTPSVHLVKEGRLPRGGQ